MAKFPARNPFILLLDYLIMIIICPIRQVVKMPVLWQARPFTACQTDPALVA